VAIAPELSISGSFLASNKGEHPTLEDIPELAEY
jgi:hypothetical protein